MKRLTITAALLTAACHTPSAPAPVIVTITSSPVASGCQGTLTIRAATPHDSIFASIISISQDEQKWTSITARYFRGTLTVEGLAWPAVSGRPNVTIFNYYLNVHHGPDVWYVPFATYVTPCSSTAETAHAP